MTEDEAFIRAIVDSPGDDLPRLVYADWLDDRADPRGPYLRAEREAVESGDVARLRELAAGLDPLWVARVSRPPVGVCCDGLIFLDTGPTLTNADISEAEGLIGIEITGAYRAFLLNYNGGIPSPRASGARHEWEGLKYPDRFSSILPPSRQREEYGLVHHTLRFRSAVSSYPSAELWGAEPDDVPWHTDVIPLNEQGSYFQLFYAVRGRYEGLLHLHDWTGELCRFGWPGEAPSLPQFLHVLTDHCYNFADTYPGQPLQEFWQT